MSGTNKKIINKSVCTKCFDKNWLIECACGCGEVLFRRDKTRRLVFYKHGHFFKGKKKDFQTGDKHWKWNGGIKTDKSGYKLIYSPNHPNRDSQGRVREHILVMEQKLGRYLKEGEEVHHINHIKHDNRIENLMLFENHSEHVKFEYKSKKRDEFGRFL